MCWGWQLGWVVKLAVILYTAWVSYYFLEYVYKYNLKPYFEDTKGKAEHQHLNGEGSLLNKLNNDIFSKYELTKNPINMT